MNFGQTIFSQLMDFITTHEFNQCVKRYNGNYKIKNFTCWEQFLCMAFAQLTYRESLRDIQACLRAANKKLYHMGIRSDTVKSFLQILLRALFSMVSMVINYAAIPSSFDTLIAARIARASFVISTPYHLSCCNCQ